MSRTNNVVNLVGSMGEIGATNPYGSNQSITEDDLPEFIKLAKHIATRQLDQSINQMFNNADDCLFEYAEKAESNQRQTLYFDAMRELRLRKDYICKRFFKTFESSFLAAYTDPAHAASGMNSNSTNNGGGLSLVEEDDLEESIAITHMSQRIFNECREELSDMVIRLNYIAEYHKFSKEDNPLCPDIICCSFRDATDCLTPIIEIKLIVFKLFDKFVVQNINSLYSNINATLIAAGVLPTIKYRTPSIAHKPSSVAASAANTVAQNVTTAINANGPTEIGQAVGVGHAGYSAATIPNSYESIRQALHEYQSGGNGILPGSVPPPRGTTAAPANGQTQTLGQQILPQAQNAQTTTSYYVSNDIIDGLSRLQSNSEYTGSESVLVSQANADIIKTGLVNDIVQFRSDQKARDIGRNEADVVDIVSMMFDYILNESKLSDRIKLSIGRLQIPIVKVAILDSEFFSKKNHPARELLNELANANIDQSSTEEHTDKVFEKIDYVTECILQEFIEDTQIFEDLLIEFREFIDTERKVDQLAKELLLNARKLVAAALQQRLENIEAPILVRQFLLGPWKAVLNDIAIRDNCAGESWDLYTNLMDNLLWSVQAKYDAEDRALLSQQIPVILLVIHQGINQIDDFQEEKLTFISELEILHLKALRSNLSQPVSTPEQSSDGRDNISASINDGASNVDSDFGTEDYSRRAENSNLSEFDQEKEKHSVYKNDLADPEMITNPYFDIVNQMPLDTWVEFSGNDEDTYSGKLSWKSSFTGDYVFMSRTYKPVADLNMRELVERFENGTARIVQNVPMLDKAIDSVIKTLHNCVGAWGNQKEMETIL